MTRTSEAQCRSQVGPYLEQAARQIISGARATLSDRTVDDTVTIHEIRKAMKRWRALLRLLAFALGDESKRLRTEARDLSHSLRHARDAQSAIDALDDVLKHQPDRALPRTAPALMRDRLLTIRAESEGVHLGSGDRDRMATTLDAAWASIDSWPLASTEFDDVAKALSKTYRRGLKLVPDDWLAADPEQLHELRQRTVELRHQLDCVGPLISGLPDRMVADAQRLRTQLGRHQDLTLLWPLMAPRQPLARWRSRLTPLIEERQRAHVAAAERTAMRVFDRPAKAFRKRLAGMWETALEDIPA